MTTSMCGSVDVLVLLFTNEGEQIESLMKSDKGETMP